MEGELKQLSLAIQQALRGPTTKSTPQFIDITERIDGLQASFSESDFVIVALTPAVRECLQLLIDLLHSSTSSSCSRIPSNLIFHSLSLLTDLIISGPCLIHLLTQCRILSLLSNLIPSLKETNVVQVLKLVSVLTEQRLSEVHVREVEPILKLCTNSVLSNSSSNEQLSASLEVLVNLYRDNVPAQTWARSLVHHDTFQKRLVSLLSNKSVGVILTSLHLLAILSLNEKLGEKIFKTSNLQQTLQLIMSVVCTSNDNGALKNAIDLTRLLLNNCHQFHQTFIGYSQLSSNLNKSFKRITELNAKNTIKMLELFCVLSDFPDIAPLIADLLFVNNSSKISPAVKGILELLAEKDTIYSSAVTEAMKLMQTMIKTDQSAQLLANNTTTLMSVLSGVTDNLNLHLSYSEGEECIRIALRKMEMAVTLLHTIVKSPLICCQVQDKLLDSTHLVDIIEEQFRHNVILNGSAEPSKWSPVGISVAVSVLRLLILTGSRSSKEDISKLLQDPKVLLMLAHGLQNGGQYLIQHSLHILHHMFTLNNNTIQEEHVWRKVITVSGFSEVLINEQRYLLGTSSYSALMCTATPTSQLSRREFGGKMKDINNVSDTKCMDTTSMEQLIERFKSGLEIRDVRASEIMNLYEHKLKIMTSKENHLQDLLEAKALALTQADRLLGQYRGKMTMSDMEFEKMRCIMQETEKECERLHDEEIVYQRQNQELNAMVNQLQSEKMQLMAVAEDHQMLTRSYQEQSTKLEVAERNINGLQELKSELEQQIINLQNSNYTLQQTVNSKLEDINQLMQRLTQCQNSLEISDAKCAELKVILKNKDSEISMLENDSKTLAQQIKELETSNCTLQHTVTSKLEDIDELTERLKQCQNLLEVSEAKCQELNVIIGNRDLQISTLENIRDGLEKRVSDLSKVFAESEDSNKNLRQKLEALEAEKNGLQEKVCQLNSEVKRLKGENCSLAQDVNLLSAVKDLISKGTKS